MGHPLVALANSRSVGSIAPGAVSRASPGANLLTRQEADTSGHPDRPHTTGSDCECAAFRCAVARCRPTTTGGLIHLGRNKQILAAIVAILIAAAVYIGALLFIVAPPAASNSLEAPPPVQPVVPSCQTVSAKTYNKALKLRANLGGPKPRKWAHKPVCVKPRYAKVRRDIRALRRCNRSNLCIGRRLAAKRGWRGSQWQCLKTLWTRESHWNHRAVNPSSGAGGIPQALPMSKMASAGSDYRTNPATQIKWGILYIRGRYGTPCAALGFHNSHNWY